MQGTKVWQSLHSCPRFLLYEEVLIYRLPGALADDCCMEKPVSICLPAVWVLLLLLIFWSKQWNYAIFFLKKNQVAWQQ